MILNVKDGKCFVNREEATKGDFRETIGPHYGRLTEESPELKKFLSERYNLWNWPL